MSKVYFEYLPTESKSIRMFCSFVNPSDLEPHSIHSRDGLFLYRPEHGRLTPIQIPIKQSPVSNSNTVSGFEYRVYRQTARPRRNIVRGSNYINSIIPRSRITSNNIRFHKRASSSAIYTISTSFREWLWFRLAIQHFNRRTDWIYSCSKARSSLCLASRRWRAVRREPRVFFPFKFHFNRKHEVGWISLFFYLHSLTFLSVPPSEFSIMIAGLSPPVSVNLTLGLVSISSVPSQISDTN